MKITILIVLFFGVIAFGRKFSKNNKLEEINFNVEIECIVLIHGWVSGPWFLKDFKRAYFSKPQRVNLIGIGWPVGSFDNYHNSVAHTKIVGDAIASFIASAIENGLLKMEKIQIIGHSLGAHVAGFTGKYLQDHGLKLPWITALDPAGPCFNNRTCSERICNTDAEWVENIHTNGGGFGMFEFIGHSDFYINGGKRQFPCLDWICSHLKAINFYVRIINMEERIAGYPCARMEELKAKEHCKNNTVRYYFGTNPQPRYHGIVYMQGIGEIEEEIEEETENEITKISEENTDIFCPSTSLPTSMIKRV